MTSIIPISASHQLRAGLGRFRNTSSTSLFSCDGKLPEEFSSSPKTRKGIGIFIGPASLHSLIDRTPQDRALLIDRNSAVLDFTKMVGAAIATVDTPDEVIGCVIDEMCSEKVEARQWPANIFTIVQQQLEEEKMFLGAQHWSEPSRFESVKEALKCRPPGFVHGDMADVRLTRVLESVSMTCNRRITFANFTNALEPQWNTPESLRPILGWPFAEDATIMYSRSDIRDEKSGLPRFLTQPAGLRTILNLRERQ